jgi:hypothetical protein
MLNAMEQNKREPETITGIKAVRYEFGTLKENIKAYPLYIKEPKSNIFLKKIKEKQEQGKNDEYFIVYRVELIKFEHEGERYNVQFKRKVLSPNSKLVQAVAKILSGDENPEEYITKYYNK